MLSSPTGSGGSTGLGRRPPAECAPRRRSRVVAHDVAGAGD